MLFPKLTWPWEYFLWPSILLGQCPVGQCLHPSIGTCTLTRSLQGSPARGQRAACLLLTASHPLFPSHLPKDRSSTYRRVSSLTPTSQKGLAGSSLCSWAKVDSSIFLPPQLYMHSHRTMRKRPPWLISAELQDDVPGPRNTSRTKSTSPSNINFSRERNYNLPGSPGFGAPQWPQRPLQGNPCS